MDKFLNYLLKRAFLANIRAKEDSTFFYEHKEKYLDLFIKEWKIKRDKNLPDLPKVVIGGDAFSDILYVCWKGHQISFHLPYMDLRGVPRNPRFKWSGTKNYRYPW